jgi:ADP-ribosyl-[dinitrogen reductase] hydrolase
VTGDADPTWNLAALHHLAARLDGATSGPYIAEPTDRIQPRQVAPGVWAADLDGARYSDPDYAVISLCRTGTRFPHKVQRFADLTDDDKNTELDAVLSDVLEDIEALQVDGMRALVHCFGGASRSGLVLRAWLRRTEGLPPTRRPRWTANGGRTWACGRTASPRRSTACGPHIAQPTSEEWTWT